MCRRDVNARRQPLKNLRKHRQERQNSRFELLPEVRERCKKSKKIDARAYVNEGSLQGRSRWPKPSQNLSQNPPQTLPKPIQSRTCLRNRRGNAYFPSFPFGVPQESPRVPRERPKSAPRAPKSPPKTLPKPPKIVPKPTKNPTSILSRLFDP